MFISCKNTFLFFHCVRFISIDPSKPLTHEQADESNKVNQIPQLQPTVSLNDTQETLSTEFNLNRSDHVYIETTTSAQVQNEAESAWIDEKGTNYKLDQVDKNDSDVSDTIEDDPKQIQSYPNETLEKNEKLDESDTEKASNGGNIEKISFKKSKN